MIESIQKSCNSPRARLNTASARVCYRSSICLLDMNEHAAHRWLRTNAEATARSPACHWQAHLKSSIMRGFSSLIIKEGMSSGLWGCRYCRNTEQPSSVSLPWITALCSAIACKQQAVTGIKKLCLLLDTIFPIARYNTDQTDMSKKHTL